ncbi:hypothetical protein F5148DRAFT_981882, partial [Russula earlei]
KLNCFVHGEGAESMFVITIKLSSDVYDLKKAIRQERGVLFQGIDVAQLCLWKASIPIDDTLDRAISTANFSLNNN